MAWNRVGGWANLPPAQVDIARIIDVTDTEAFLVRKDGDGGDVFVVDTTNGVVAIGGVTPVTGCRLVLPLENDAVTPTLAFGDGDTGFFEDTDDSLRVSIGQTSSWRWATTFFTGNTSGSAGLNNVTASATVPGVIFGGDPNTGIGHAAADQLSLITGGVEKARFTLDGATLYAVVFEGSVVTNEDEMVFT